MMEKTAQLTTTMMQKERKELSSPYTLQGQGPMTSLPCTRLQFLKVTPAPNSAISQDQAFNT
jgi:hypothetical protein